LQAAIGATLRGVSWQRSSAGVTAHRNVPRATATHRSGPWTRGVKIDFIRQQTWPAVGHCHLPRSCRKSASQISRSYTRPTRSSRP